MNIIEKDILTVTQGVIVHQVNCKGVMGAGLAKKIVDKWPVVQSEYRRECHAGFHRVGALGNVLLVKVSPTLIVANVFGQLSYGKNKCHTRYWALANGFNKLHRQKIGPLSVYLPYGIDCGQKVKTPHRPQPIQRTIKQN